MTAPLDNLASGGESVNSSKVKAPYQDALVDAEVVAIKKIEEGVNRYHLADGTILSMRTVVVQVSRLVGITDDAGAPVYNVQSQNVVAVSRPTEEDPEDE